MKRCVTAMAFLLTAQLASAQPPGRLYAWSQAFTPGIVPQRDMRDEDGNSVPGRPTTIIRYYIYISTGSTISIQPKEIWILGKCYRIKASPVVKTPVFAEGPEKKTLVPFTRLKLRQLEPGDTLPSPKRTASLEKRLEKNELTLVYAWKGKTYYSSVKKIRILDPVHAE